MDDNYDYFDIEVDDKGFKNAKYIDDKDTLWI